MQILRILTNNAVVILGENKKEQIVCGKGIAYKNDLAITLILP